MHFPFDYRRWSMIACLGALVLVAPPCLAQEPLADEGVVVQEIDATVAAAAAPAAPTSDTVRPAPSESLLAFTYRALGLRYTLAFLAISFTFVALVVMNVLAVRQENIAPVELVDAFDAQVEQGKFQEAYDLAKTSESFLGQVLASGVAKLPQGYSQSIEAMQEVGEEENMKLDHRLSYLALIGTISPMVGLLGTVDGMVAAFRVIATSTTQPKPSDLAQGISMALVTTLIGLTIAIPAIAIYNILRNRVARLILEVGIVSEKLLNRFAEASQKAAKS